MQPCRKCGAQLELVAGIYGKYLRCPNDDICQNVDREGRPIGDQSDQPTRDARKSAHAQFDQLWKLGVFESRGKAYRWLADQFKVERIHIGESSIEQCKKIGELSHARMLEGFRQQSNVIRLTGRK